MADNHVAIDHDQVRTFVNQIREAGDKMAAAAKSADALSHESIDRWGTETGPAFFHSLFVAEMLEIRDEYRKLQADFHEFATLVEEAAKGTLDAEADQALALRIQQVTLEMDKPKQPDRGLSVYDPDNVDMYLRHGGRLRLERE